MSISARVSFTTIIPRQHYLTYVLGQTSHHKLYSFDLISLLLAKKMQYCHVGLQILWEIKLESHEKRNIILLGVFLILPLWQISYWLDIGGQLILFTLILPVQKGFFLLLVYIDFYDSVYCKLIMISKFHDNIFLL